jgi:Uma2 family endonuclease
MPGPTVQINPERTVEVRSEVEAPALVMSSTERNGWEIHTNLSAHIPLTRERLIPDLMVVPADAPGCGDEEVHSPGILLVAEVVSPSSRRQDRETKTRAYARGGVPLYLLVDRFAEPPGVTLFSRPGPDGYQTVQKATAGQPLRLPAPIDVSLDTAKLLA